MCLVDRLVLVLTLPAAVDGAGQHEDGVEVPLPVDVSLRCPAE